jgi:hypothetical protein
MTYNSSWDGPAAGTGSFGTNIVYTLSLPHAPSRSGGPIAKTGSVIANNNPNTKIKFLLFIFTSVFNLFLFPYFYLISGKAVVTAFTFRKK